MAASFTTSSINPETDTALNAILEPFGFTASQMSPLLYKTSAVMAGGAVTHYLATRDPSLGFSDLVLPPSSDLDFWVCNPIPKSDDMFYARRAYTNLVVAEFMRLLEPLDFNYNGTSVPPKSFPGCEKSHGDYLFCREEFKAQGDIAINVHWCINYKTKRIINLIFTDKSIKDTVSKFDFPITFAFIFCTGREYIEKQQVKIAFDPRVLEDLKDRLLTEPDSTLTSLKPEEVVEKRRVDRARKYLNRYGMVFRVEVPDVAAGPVVPGSVAAVPVVPVSVAEVPDVAEVPVVPDVAEVPVSVAEVPDVAEVPVVPDVAAVPVVPDVAAVPVVPDVAEVPVVPDVAAVPVVPDVAEVPVVPAL
jgi:hypothetical protein